MFLIRNGNLHLPGGEVLPGTDVLVDGDRIARLGRDLSADAESYDAAGKEVFPGLILPVTAVGVTDYANLRQGDANEDSSPVTPDLHVKYALDAREVAIQEYQSHGVTAFGAAPGTHGVLPGRMGVYHTAGRCPAGMAVRETVAMKANFIPDVKQTYGPRNTAPMTRMGIAALLRGALEKARRYDPAKGWDPACEALGPVLSGELPLLVTLNTVGEITTVLDIACAYGVRVILHGAYQAADAAEAIRAAGASILLGDLISGTCPTYYNADLAAILALGAQGVPLALSNAGDGGSAGHETLLWGAEKLVRDCGADPDALMDMMSIDTARILGVDDLTGSIAEGKFADLAVWTGHPLRECAAYVDLCLTAGEIWRCGR